MIEDNSLDGLPSGMADQIRNALKRYPDVKQALLFGSRALGTHRPNSDIDLCLDAPAMSFAAYLKLAALLDELVLPYSLDLVLKHQVDNPDFLEHIQRVGRVVYQATGSAG